jgi:hypothetical protein
MSRLPLLLPLIGALLLAACTRGDARNAQTSAVEENVTLPLVTVYKTPTCGCCVAWAEYMEDEGFTVRQVDVATTADVRNRLGVPSSLGSCHTAVVGDYVVEGHVPAEDVKRLLRDRPDATGIAVPGMPLGSPGMEVPGREPQPYEVLLFASDGRVAVFSRH